MEPTTRTLHHKAETQLDLKLQQAEEKKTCLALEIGFQAGMAIQMLQVEKLQLASLNRTLIDEMIQIKLHHSEALQTLIKTNQAKINLVAEKVKIIVEKIDSYKKKEAFSQFFFSADDIKLLSTLQTQISNVNLDHLKKYPEYPCKQETQITSQEQKIEFPFSNALLIQEKEPMTKELVQKYIGTYKSLENEIQPLRIVKREINNKEVIIDFHKKHMQKIEREGIKSVLTKIVELFNYYNPRIKWENLILVNAQFFNTLSLTPYTKEIYISEVKNLASKKSSKLRMKMNEIISMVNTFINPQPGK